MILCPELTYETGSCSVSQFEEASFGLGSHSVGRPESVWILHAFPFFQELGPPSAPVALFWVVKRCDQFFRKKTAVPSVPLTTALFYAFLHTLVISSSPRLLPSLYSEHLHTWFTVVLFGTRNANGKSVDQVLRNTARNDVKPSI